MSEPVKTDAVVLRVMKYRDTSLIVTLYTRQFGKLSGVVKGARSQKSKFGPVLQPMSYVQAMVYRKEGRDLQIIGQCDLIHAYRHIMEDLGKMAAGMKMIELVHVVTHEEEENSALFDLLASSLGALDGAKKHPLNLCHVFEISLSHILGFTPVFDACVSCGKTGEMLHGGQAMIKFHPERGGPLCATCASVPGLKIQISVTTMRILQRLSSASEISEIPSVEITKKEHEEIENLLRAYLRHHISGMRTLKSEKVFAKILADS
jgi:DNA repair protein RecO (recombination protein O)